MATSTLLLFAAYAIAIAAAGWYAYQHRQKLGCLHCMQVGMVFGGITGLVVATLYAMETGNFVWSMIFGTAAGLVVGVPLGLLGGYMGRMEAVMGAPMGGFMGGMLGVMVRIYDVDLFVSFFTAVIGVMMAEMAYVIFKTVNQRRATVAETAFASFMIGAVVLATTFSSFTPSAVQNPGWAFLSNPNAASPIQPGVQAIQVQGGAPSVQATPQAAAQQPAALLEPTALRLEPESLELPAVWATLRWGWRGKPNPGFAPRLA